MEKQNQEDDELMHTHLEMAVKTCVFGIKCVSLP